MTHTNIFNSGAERLTAERNYKIFNRSSLAAGIIGLAAYIALAMGAEHKSLPAVAGFGMAFTLFSGETIRKREERLKAARNDIYTPAL